MDEQTAADSAVERKQDEFVYLPLDQIYVEAQIRTDISVEDDEFKAMTESIRDVGVLEPVITAKSLRADAPAPYLLISGERRYLACRQLGLLTIPAIIKPDVKTQEEILAIQLTENLHRKNLNAVDEANAYLKYVQGRHPGMDPDGITNKLLDYKISATRVENAFTTTVVVVCSISGKSLSSLQNSLSLLKLPEEIQEAVKTGWNYKVVITQNFLLRPVRNGRTARLPFPAAPFSSSNLRRNRPACRRSGSSGDRE
jgi:hypothetical protein